MTEQSADIEGRRNRLRPIGLIAGLAAAAALLAACGASQAGGNVAAAEALPASPTAVAHQELGTATLPELPRLPAPDFRLPDLGGKTWTLSQFRGQPVMLFFWATW
jgi:cytochrome oxidase Cu insertion factor (SCO1/SenC/PrrC family)